MKPTSAPPEKPSTGSKRAIDTKKIGTKTHIATRANGGSWVQTEKSGHEAWSRLSIKAPLASALMHVLVARMGSKNALVVSQKTLAKIIGVTDRSIRTAVAVLVEDRWIEVVRINGPGTVSAYVVNASVAWSQKRENLHLAAFSAVVIADADDQDKGISHRQLRKIPMLYAGEQQLPTGPGEDPPAQSLIEGMEPDLPSLSMLDEDLDD
jgi:hypothetical protein